MALDGEGFEVHVADGQRVRAGEPLLRFDLDLVARRARSLMTPVVLAGGTVRRTALDRAVAVGEVLLEVEVEAARPLAATGAR